MPQADDLANVREVDRYWSHPGGSVAGAARTLALAKRDYGQYSQAAETLREAFQGLQGDDRSTSDERIVAAIVGVS